jgi:hypothetical protein
MKKPRTKLQKQVEAVRQRLERRGFHPEIRTEFEESGFVHYLTIRVGNIRGLQWDAEALIEGTEPRPGAKPVPLRRKHIV